MLTAFATRTELMEAATQAIAVALRTGIAARGEACAALSGGTTPAPAYERLARLELDWSKVTLALADERLAPVDQDASNEGMLRRTLGPALARGARIAPLFSDAATVAEAAARADALYARLRFDIVLLGMGLDGHTASWFPGAAGLVGALDLTNPRSVVALDAPQAYGARLRLSLTRSALARADAIVVLIAGEDKRERFEAALRKPIELAPIAALFDGVTREPAVFWAP